MGVPPRDKSFAIIQRMRSRGSGRRSGVTAVALVVAVACSALVLAQTPGRNLREPGPTTVGQTQQGAPQPTFRAGVTLVTSDVIVRDRDGVFMPDLTKDDFRVLEDGVEQEVVSLVLIHGGRVYNQLIPPPPVQEGIILPASRPPNDTAGRIFVLFVDDLHLEASATPKIRQVFKKIADTLVHEGDLFGIISSGPSSISVDMTYDRSVLYDAMERIIGDGLSIEDVLIAQAGASGPTEVVYRAHVAFKTARGVLRNLEQVTNRRKVFIYLSNGYDLNPFADSRAARRNEVYNQGQLQGLDQGDFASLPDPATDPFERELRRGEVFADANLNAELAELTRVANRANTSFYTFDPRGLVAGLDIDETLPLVEWNQHIYRTQNSLRMLAELTGGTAVVNRNDFEGALREIDAETSDYYVVGFYSSNPDPTLRTRRLKVEIQGREDDGLDVRGRTHYTLPRGPA